MILPLPTRLFFEAEACASGYAVNPTSEICGIIKRVNCSCDCVAARWRSHVQSCRAAEQRREPLYRIDRPAVRGGRKTVPPFVQTTHVP